ncbi:Protein SHOOT GRAVITROPISM 5 [Hibiscus syriacus]|uniref:Protein SHOOT GRAVITROPISM 5 n=1 Tax=Hibiscus syriacus TaxID=106335 RepID=A0A6A3BRH6_HIBSY|nr:zinc finger protein SHOOT GRAVITROPISM 5-like [Hibiscus syriacus]KAE8719204.1 Protein SHOOT GRAVITROPISM 5 [Hibiscus syriacus]
MLDNNTSISVAALHVPSSSFVENRATHKRKRKPAGTPDPDAEVVSLSPKTLLESDRYVCEICNQGFQRDQNLQMHRRRHKVPWKLLKRESQEVKKRVFVCPEQTCLHHDPCHALGDLVGIKKHFRRKHSNQKQWVCEKCSKGYAVHSDYKAHLKTCGTRGHSCDCGRVFSRVESFIEHQDICTVRWVQPDQLQASQTASTTSPSSDAANFSIALLRGLSMLKPTEPVFVYASTSDHQQHQQQRNLELQLLPTRDSDENYATHLKLSIGSNEEKNETTLEATRMKEFAGGQLKLAMAEKAYAEKARQEAKRQNEMAELEFASAKRIRQQAQTELEKAQALKDQATQKISATIMQITCQTCKHQFQTSTAAVPDDETSLVMSYMSSATTEGEGE